MIRQHYLATAEKLLTLLWLLYPPLKLEIACSKQMHASKCLQKTPKLLPSCDYGVNIFSVILKRCPVQFCKRTYEDHTAVQAASEKEGKCDESFWCYVCRHRVIQGFFTSWKKDDWLKYYQDSQEVYRYNLNRSWVFATLLNITQCFREQVTFILYAAKQKEVVSSKP